MHTFIMQLRDHGALGIPTVEIDNIEHPLDVIRAGITEKKATYDWAALRPPRQRPQHERLSRKHLEILKARHIFSCVVVPTSGVGQEQRRSGIYGRLLKRTGTQVAGSDVFAWAPKGGLVVRDACDIALLPIMLPREETFILPHTF